MAIRKLSPRAFDSTASSANLNIDSGTMIIDATNNRVGINRTPSFSLDVNGTARVMGATSSASFLLYGANAPTDGAYSLQTASRKLNIVDDYSGTTAVTIDAANNWDAYFVGSMGLGMSPTRSGAYGRGLYISGAADDLISLWSQPINTNDHRLTLSNNVYNAGVGIYKYLAANQSATIYSQRSGIHEFYTAGTGTANATIGFGNAALTIQSDRAIYSPNNYYTAADGLISLNGTWTHSNGGYTSYGSLTPWRKFVSHASNNLAEYNFTMDIGNDGIGTSTQYWYLVLPTNSTTYMGMFNVEVFVAGWNWGQTVGYKRWVVGSNANTWVVTLAEEQNRANTNTLSCYATAVGSTSCKIGFLYSSGRNGFNVRITAVGDALSAVTNTYQTNTNPF